MTVPVSAATPATPARAGSAAATPAAPAAPAPAAAAPAGRDWTASFARRTQLLGGGEITAILALAGATDVITFSGGFPDPETFPVDVLAGIRAG